MPEKKKLNMAPYRGYDIQYTDDGYVAYADKEQIGTSATRAGVERVVDRHLHRTSPKGQPSPALKPLAKHLTPEQEQLIQTIAERVWQDLAGDLFSALAEEGKTSIPRAEVMEVVADAGRMEEIAQRKVDEGKRYEAVLPFLKHAGQDEMNKVLKKHFTFARYS